jgi:ribosomal protein S12 methylthiotransferase
MTQIAFITLGCAKNEVDTDKMRAHAVNAGYGLVEDPTKADVIILNTCSFITEATEEAIAAILEALDLPRVSAGDAKLVVTGCLPARYGSELSEGFPEVAAFIGPAEEESIVTHIERLMGAPKGTVANAPHIGRMTTRPWAYVKIADGCDRHCSFCTIPLIRGPYRSYPLADISAEVQELVSGGVREIVLIAQDTGIWQPSLPLLLKTLAERFGDTWFRVMYLQPQGVTDELLATMASYPNICAYLDIPLQHANRRILREMNRAGDGAAYLALLERIRGVDRKSVV